MPRCRPPNVVRLGELILKTSADKDKHRDVKIVARIVHPSYNVSSRYHDIALLKLSADVPLTPSIRPTCLFTLRNAPRKDKVIITGFGKTGYGLLQQSPLHRRRFISTLLRFHRQLTTRAIVFSRPKLIFCRGNAATILQEAIPNLPTVTMTIR